MRLDAGKVRTKVVVGNSRRNEMKKDEIIRLYIGDLIAHVEQSPARDNRIAQMKEELERSDNSDYAKCSRELIDLNNDGDKWSELDIVTKCHKKI